MYYSKKYRLIILLSASNIFFSFSQNTEREWKVDSMNIRQTSAPSWKVDSISEINSENNWKVVSASPSEIASCFMWRADEVDRANITVSGASTFSDGDFAPFWLTNNQYGIGSINRNKVYSRLNAFAYKNVYRDINNINISGGIDLLVSNNLASDFYLHQLYLDIGYKGHLFILSIGAKERQPLFKNTELSSGGMTLSANARPIPQVELKFPEFIPIPYTNNKLYVMGGISYGWFNDDKFKKQNSEDGYYAENVLYHRKYGFLKYKPSNTWEFIVGLEMDTQWGGDFYQRGEHKYSGSAKLKDFFKVLLPMSGGSDSNITDKVNIVGNVYGSSHFIAKYDNDNLGVKAYHEHFFEDHSGLFFKNMPDGLYGIELKLKKQALVSDLLFEYIHTKDQSGPFLWDKNDEIPIQVSGGDNYYNHVDYISLTNYGYTIGNPLLTSPIYNEGKSQTIYNSRISAFHGGISGYIHPYLKYRLLATYSRSWGIPLIPSVSIRDQFSSLFEVTYNNPRKLKGWLFSASIAYDKSDMIGDNTGVQLKISRDFNIPLFK